MDDLINLEERFTVIETFKVNKLPTLELRGKYKTEIDLSEVHAEDSGKYCCLAPSL